MPEFFTGLATAGINNLLNFGFGNLTRANNYKYNEMSADNADKRTRALYNDLYSPQAQLQQIKEAGLSPSLFYGQASGISGQAGAQGGGAAGPQTNAYAIDPMLASQIKLNEAQANNLDAKTRNTEKDTDIKVLEEKMKQAEANWQSIDFSLTTIYLTDQETGEQNSLFTTAQKFKSYEEFVKHAEESAKRAKMQNIVDMIHTERGQQTMRNIYKQAKEFSKDLNNITLQNTSIKFQKSIVDALNNTDYAKLNAQSAIKFLEANIETSELTAQQRGAWNDLLHRLGEKGETYKDIAIVMGMIVNAMFSNWHTPTIVNKNYEITQ